MAKKKMTHYQQRMTKLVVTSNVYLVACPIAFFFTEASPTAWLIWISTAAVLFGLAAALDAVFDSLSERINIQSAWLDVRLSVLERAVGARSGQEAWRNQGVATDDPEHYFYAYPERLEARPED